MANDSDDAYETLMQFLYRAPIGLAQTNLQGAIELINPMSARLLMPLSRDGSLDNLFDALADVAPELRSLAAAFAPASGVICESLRIRMPPSQRGPGSQQVLSLSLLKLGENRLMAALSDATLEAQREQQGLARRLNDAARTDSLTLLPNRAALRERLQHVLDNAAERPHRHAVLFLNCDRFKQINDTLGHAAGDELLGLLADRLRTTLRQRGRHGLALDAPPAVEMLPVEQAAARVGSDEFVVVLDDLARADDVHVVAQRLIDALAKPYGLGTRQVHCSVSMGIVLQAQAAGDADAVLQDASIAMVEAKRAGGARYTVFEPWMQARATQRAGTEAALRIALTGGQLFVVYQPVVGLQCDGGVDRHAGVEALVRWRHPQRGVVPPFEFIGIAEECGLIDAIGDFVLETACHQFVAWQRAMGDAAPRSLAVNLSRAQLAQPGWANTVQSTLRAAGMAPAQLQLEVTESLAAQDAGVQSQLHALKELGLRLALDDFGTGYSSLASLHLLPVDTVKIDRSFVSLADTSAHHRVLIEATVRVANSLGMGTVAEGIETEAQAAVVRSLGCEKGQGYLYARPLAADELMRWLLPAVC